MAATSGLCESSTRFSSAWVRADRDSESSRVFRMSKTLMSAPAMNVDPAPISTMASAEASAFARATASSIPSHTAGLNALTGGLSMVMTATLSLMSYRMQDINTHAYISDFRFQISDLRLHISHLQGSSAPRGGSTTMHV